MNAVQCTIFLTLIHHFIRVMIMTTEIDNTAMIKTQLLKPLSRMYETGISIKHISEGLKIDKPTVKGPIKPLGYTSAI